MDEFCREHPELCPKYYDVAPYRTSFGNTIGRKAQSSKPVPVETQLGGEGIDLGVIKPERPKKQKVKNPFDFGSKPEIPPELKVRTRKPKEDTRQANTDFGTGRLSQIQYQVSRPDPQTQAGIKQVSRKIRKQRTKALEKISAETEVVEHSAEEFLNAVLSQAAYENAYKGKNAASRYVKKKASILPELENIELIRDPKFTNNNHSAFRNVKTGEVYMSYRGSDADFFDPEANIESLMRGQGNRLKNATDWSTNLHTLGGKEHKTKRYKDAVKVAKELAAAEGISIHDLNTTGHSLGGGQSDHVSEVLGTKSYSFDPARNPFAKRPVHSKSKIKSSGTWFDPVGLARNAHARYKGGEPEHIEMKNYWAVPGKESGFITHHDLEGQFIDPIELKGDKLVSTRVKPWRNLSNMIGGATRAGLTKAVEGMGGAMEIAGLALPFALTPKFSTKAETTYRKGEAFVDNAEITMAMSNALFKVNPMFFLLDEPAMMATIMDFDPMLPPEAKRWVQKQLGIKIKDEPVRYTPPPKLIAKWATKERKAEEAQMAATQRTADAYGITFQEALALTPETDPGLKLSEGAEERVEEQLEDFTERTRAYREQQKTEDRGWERFYNPAANPFPVGANPYGIGSKEFRDYLKRSDEWREQAIESAKIQYRQNQAEIERYVQQQEQQERVEQEIKYKQSPQYNLEIKEEQMAVESGKLPENFKI